MRRGFFERDGLLAISDTDRMSVCWQAVLPSMQEGLVALPSFGVPPTRTYLQPELHRERRRPKQAIDPIALVEQRLPDAAAVGSLSYPGPNLLRQDPPHGFAQDP